MTAKRITIDALPSFPLVEPGDDLAGMILQSMDRHGMDLADGDVLVVAQKVVSKAEGRYVDLDDVVPGDAAHDLALKTGKTPALCQVILNESDEIMRHRPGLVIARHKRGWVMANAGLDQSNIAAGSGAGRVLLLPNDPDASAASLRDALERHAGRRLGVIINDSVGRAWRTGIVGTALGAAGVRSVADLRGAPDLFGRILAVTISGTADEIASAASLVQGQAGEGMPVVRVRGLDVLGPGSGADLVRPAEQDMFR